MNIIFLDFDGVLTNMHETPGSYINHIPEQYGISKSNLDNLLNLCEECNAKIIISSNWRRFPEDGTWTYKIGVGNDNRYHSVKGVYPNPIPLMKKTLGNKIIGTLPLDKHILKSEALILWFEENDFDGNFVIIDDDSRENFQTTHDYNIKDHFVLTDFTVGFSKYDYMIAKNILMRK